MCIRDREKSVACPGRPLGSGTCRRSGGDGGIGDLLGAMVPVSYTHLRVHETVLDLVCRLMLDKKKKKNSRAAVELESYCHCGELER